MACYSGIFSFDRIKIIKKDYLIINYEKWATKGLWSMK